mgnify:CR=1 FL=1
MGEGSTGVKEAEIPPVSREPQRNPPKFASRRSSIKRERARTAEAEKKSKVDSLTGLPNELAFLEELPRTLALANREGRKIYLVYYDYDDMHGINDRFGHSGGDEAIKLAAALQGRLEEQLYRLHGDEFVRIAYGHNGDKEIAAAMKRDRTALTQLSLPLFKNLPVRSDRVEPLTEEARNKPLALTMGAISFTGNRDHEFDAHTAASNLLKQADEVMMYGKDQGRNVGFIGGVTPNGSINYKIAA